MADEANEPTLSMTADAAPPAPAEKTGHDGAAPAPVAAASNTLPENWRDSLPDDIKGEESLKMYKDLPSLAKSLVHAQKQIGKDKISVPDPKLATDDDYNKIFRKLGLPEKVEDYAIKLADDSGLDPGFMAKFKENSLAAGILPRQAQRLLDWYTAESKAQIAEVEGQFAVKREEQMTRLKSDWGKAFSQELSKAQLAVKDVADAADIEYLNANGYDKDPVLLRMFAKLGGMLSDDKIVGKGGKSSLMTPKDAQVQIDSIMGDAEHPYNNAKHPSHKHAVDSMQALYSQAHPSDA